MSTTRAALAPRTAPAHPTQTDPVPTGRPLSRRVVLGGGLGLAAAALVGRSPAHAEPVAAGQVLATYLAAGGSAVLGAAVGPEVRQRIDHRNTYGQRFEHGTVWWGSGVGKVDRPAHRVRLDSAPSFRPVSGVRDVWRTDDLDGCSPLEKRVVADLGIAVMIAMNSGGDPTIPGVRSYRYEISNAGTHRQFYRGYVTRSTSRRAVGRVLRRVARTDAPVLVHCKAGKDRTGWVCDLLLAVAGVDQAVRNVEYLATQAYSGAEVDLAWLDVARDRLASDYGTVEAYLVDGCGLATADLDRLRTRLG